MKQRLLILSLSSVLLSAGIVGAQQAQQNSQAAPTQSSAASTTAALQLREHLARRVLGRPLELGSTVSVTFYNGDPEAGGTELTTLEFVYGEDSEAAFAQTLMTTAPKATYMTLTTSPQTETINFEDAAMAQLPGGPGFGPDGMGPSSMGSDGMGPGQFGHGEAGRGAFGPRHGTPGDPR